MSTTVHVPVIICDGPFVNHLNLGMASTLCNPFATRLLSRVHHVSALVLWCSPDSMCRLIQMSEERENFCITQLVTVTDESVRSQFILISPEPRSFSWVYLALQIERRAAPATNGHSHGFNKTLLGHWEWDVIIITRNCGHMILAMH